MPYEVIAAYDHRDAIVRIVAFIDDQATIDRILKHLASPASSVFDPFEARPPPPN